MTRAGPYFVKTSSFAKASADRSKGKAVEKVTLPATLNIYQIILHNPLMEAC
jgi:hypothetical protein